MTGQPTRYAYVKKAHIKLKRLKEERGSALVLVMFILLLLTILGLSVLSATIGGAQRTETRKNDVQSLHLAEKTLDEAVAYITSSLNKKIESNIDMSQEDLDQAIKNFWPHFQPHFQIHFRQALRQVLVWQMQVGK